MVSMEPRMPPWCAGRIAGELKAAQVLFLTDIAGDLDKNWDLLKSLTCDDIDGLIKDETITGGMFPKGEIDDTFVICSFVWIVMFA